MKKFFSFLFGLCLVVMLLPVLAFGKPFLTCDPQPYADSYNVFLDGTLIATPASVLDVESGHYYLWLDLTTLGLADGSYVATATALNEWEEESGLSNSCPFTKATPANPLGLRVSSEP